MPSTETLAPDPLVPVIRRVGLHGLTIEVRGPKVLQRTANLVFHAYPAADASAKADVTITASRQSGQRILWLISAGGRTRRASTGVSEAARWTEWMVVSEALEHWATRFIHVHAGVVGTPSGSALLIGRSGSGKSTTTTALALEGMQLYSDDVGLIDRSTMRPYCVPRPIKLDVEARRQLRRRGLVIPRGTRLGESVDRTVIPGLPPVEEPGPPVRTAVFFAAERKASARIRPITGAEAVMRLISQSTSETLSLTGPSESAVALINSVQCVELIAGDLGSTVRVLRDFLSSGHQCQGDNG